MAMEMHSFLETDAPEILRQALCFSDSPPRKSVCVADHLPPPSLTHLPLTICCPRLFRSRGSRPPAEVCVRGQGRKGRVGPHGPCKHGLHGEPVRLPHAPPQKPYHSLMPGPPAAHRERELVGSLRLSEGQINDLDVGIRLPRYIKGTNLHFSIAHNTSYLVRQIQDAMHNAELGSDEIVKSELSSTFPTTHHEARCRAWPRRGRSGRALSCSKKHRPDSAPVELVSWPNHSEHFCGGVCGQGHRRSKGLHVAGGNGEENNRSEMPSSLTDRLMPHDPPVLRPASLPHVMVSHPCAKGHLRVFSFYAKWGHMSKLSRCARVRADVQAFGPNPPKGRGPPVRLETPHAPSDASELAQNGSPAPNRLYAAIPHRHTPPLARPVSLSSRTGPHDRLHRFSCSAIETFIVMVAPIVHVVTRVCAQCSCSSSWTGVRWLCGYSTSISTPKLPLAGRWPFSELPSQGSREA